MGVNQGNEPLNAVVVINSSAPLLQNHWEKTGLLRYELFSVLFFGFFQIFDVTPTVTATTTTNLTCLVVWNQHQANPTPTRLAARYYSTSVVL